MRCLAVIRVMRWQMGILVLILAMLVSKASDKTAAVSVVTAAPVLADRPVPVRSSLTRPAGAFR
jgi:hypothetical protein